MFVLWCQFVWVFDNCFSKLVFKFLWNFTRTVIWVKEAPHYISLATISDICLPFLLFLYMFRDSDKMYVLMITLWHALQIVDEERVGYLGDCLMFEKT